MVRLVSALKRDARYELVLFQRVADEDMARPGGAMAVIERLETRLRPLSKPVEAPVSDVVPGQPDVVIDFSMSQVAFDIATQARFGMWRLSSYAADAGWAEMSRGAPFVKVMLSRVGRDGEDSFLAAGSYDTKPLVSMTKAYLREKSVQLVLRELARCDVDGQGPRFEMVPGHASVSVAGYLGAVAGEAAGRVVRKVRSRMGRAPRQFRLRYGRGGLDDFDPASAIEVTPERGTFAADPFLFQWQGATYCFYEEYDYSRGLGHLSVARVDEAGWHPLGEVMRRDIHLSFPFVFEQDGEVYMIPETCAAKRVEVWRATDFPLGWELHTTALEGQAASDVVLAKHGGETWMFANLSSDSFGDFCSDLHVFRVDGPALKSVEPHPMNPVVIDSATARNAGRVHVGDGRLVRMSQDNTGGVYGYGLNVMEITELTLEAYSERRLRHVTPEQIPGVIGCHHADFADGWFVVDVRHP
ncbi:glucosamine inositolphosphorylceramide transferase family protein [Shimia abyssi]|uniref:glucosamine inositolphosphorylceramide transferase family protein n=1 Tax=Shimia abyssi TaxID=1662395 RepID=UPI001056F3D1|nr:hypothetical protein [Shimia abyssi]